MARKPMVTRTIVTTEVNVLALNIVKGEPFNAHLVLPRTYSDDAKLLKNVQEFFDNEEQKAVHIVEKKEVETLYGMSEQEFIANASVLDPETRRLLEQGEESKE